MSDPQVTNRPPDFTRTIPNQYTTVFVDVVGECNLRCVYCYQSDEDFKPHGGMSPAVIESVIHFAKIYGGNAVNVTSAGEFTFGKDWRSTAQRLLEAGLFVCTTSNLARLLDRDEIGILSRFASICLSLDSTDRDTLKSIRRSADIRTIAHNVLRIRAAAIADGRPPTPFVINCVLSTGNAAGIVDLVTYCCMLGMSGVVVSPLHAYGDFGFDKKQLGDERVDDPVDAWSLPELKRLYDDLIKASQIAKRGNMGFGINPAIAQRLTNKLNGVQTQETLRPGLTRICTQPWDRVIIEHDGTVKPCCYGGDTVGNVASQPFEQVVNGEKMLALKTSLLTGVDLPAHCRNCVGEAVGTTDQLKANLQSYFNARCPPARKAS